MVSVTVWVWVRVRPRSNESQVSRFTTPVASLAAPSVSPNLYCTIFEAKRDSEPYKAGANGRIGSHLSP